MSTRKLPVARVNISDYGRDGETDPPVEKRLKDWTPDLSNPGLQGVIASSVAINTLALAVPFYINRVYTSIIPSKSGGSLTLITALLLAAVALDLFLKIARTWTTTLLSGSEQHTIRLDATRRALAAQYSSIQSKTSWELLEEVRATGYFKRRLTEYWISKYIDIPFTLIYWAVLGIIGGPLCLIPIATALAIYPYSKAQSEKAADAISHRFASQEYRDEFLSSALKGRETIKGLGLEGFLTRRVEPIQEDMSSSEFSMACINNQLRFAGQAYGQITGMLIVTLGSILVIRQDLTIGALAACTLLSRQVTQPLSRYFTLKPRTKQMEYGMNKINLLLDLPASDSFFLPAEERPSKNSPVFIANKPLTKDGKYIISPRSNTSPQDVLRSLRSQESTLGISVGQNRTDLRSYPDSQRRKLAPIISATPTMFTGSIIENLTSFISSKTDEAISICKKLDIINDISALPMGLLTQTGENGDHPIRPTTRLKIRIAAAVISGAKILIIDSCSRELSEEQVAWLSKSKLDLPLVVVSDNEYIDWSGSHFTPLAISNDIASLPMEVDA